MVFGNVRRSVMPWTVSDVDKHKKGLDKTQKQKWVRIANNVLKECMDSRNDTSECEAQAIRTANSRVGKSNSGSKDKSYNGE
jgi:hypothetical protein